MTKLRARLLSLPECKHKGPIILFWAEPSFSTLYDIKEQSLCELDCHIKPLVAKMGLDQYDDLEELKPRLEDKCLGDLCHWCPNLKHKEKCPNGSQNKEYVKKFEDLAREARPVDQTVLYGYYVMAMHNQTGSWITNINDLSEAKEAEIMEEAQNTQSQPDGEQKLRDVGLAGDL